MPRDAGSLEEDLLRSHAAPGAHLRLADGEQELAARLVVPQLGEVERFERRLVQARGLLVGEQLERADGGLAGVSETLVPIIGGDRMLRELGEV